jgi:hypothetical protein
MYPVDQAGLPPTAFAAPYDRVWDAAVAALRTQFPLVKADPARGEIEGAWDYAEGLTSGTGYRRKASITVRRKDPETTEVRIVVKKEQSAIGTGPVTGPGADWDDAGRDEDMEAVLAWHMKATLGDLRPSDDLRRRTRGAPPEVPGSADR